MRGDLKRFFIREGRLHPGWRVALYFILTLASMLLAQAPIVVVYITYLTLSGLSPETMLSEVAKLPLALTLPATAMQLSAILLLTYLFRRFLDRQSFASLGFARRRGWPGEIGFGVVLGFALMSAVFFAVVISSTLFGLVHGLNPNFNPIAALNIALAGVAFCYAYLITGNLWLPLAFHFSWNFFQGPVFSFPVSGVISGGLLLTQVRQAGHAITGGGFGPEGGLMGLGAQALGLLALWLWAKGRTS